MDNRALHRLLRRWDFSVFAGYLLLVKFGGSRYKSFKKRGGGGVEIVSSVNIAENDSSDPLNFFRNVLRKFLANRNFQKNARNLEGFFFKEKLKELGGRYFLRGVRPGGLRATAGNARVSTKWRIERPNGEIGKGASVFHMGDVTDIGIPSLEFGRLLYFEW